ncbi:aminotransferase class I/II-fold pyridoxal phosphate-dependent enzyme [Myxococcota bacterium]|nr:aminotransferase class I/II-fold pyridoxal phosphate-dependent enzyme [Myxococcota bacterium]
MSNQSLDVTRFFPQGDAVAAAEAASLSRMARGMQGSKILQIAYEVQARIKAGHDVADFTVGDFARSEFRVPDALIEHTAQALKDGHTNYPPADGLAELRQAIVAQAERELGLKYPVDTVVVGSGARPLLYGAYRCLIDAGEKVVYPAPSWNNKNFCHQVGAVDVVVPTTPESNFMPDVKALEDALPGARMLVLCSPGNPTGTMIREAAMREIGEYIVAENAARKARGERLLYLVYDQVYRNLTFGDFSHVTPVGVVPAMAEYTLFVDAISKCFAATGLRVGWMYGPPHVARQVKALMTHMGAWAPRPEQVATAKLLNDAPAMKAYLEHHLGGIHARLDALSRGLTAMKAEGLPVVAIEPEGAIYLSVRFDLLGRGGLNTEDAVRQYLLEKAGVAVVPFSAFGDSKNRNWWRFSVGAVSVAQIEACLPRLREALRSVM